MDLFGKRQLEERVAGLEKELAQCKRERSELSSSLERREARLKKLASEYQEANQALKKALLQLEQAEKGFAQTEPETTSNHAEACPLAGSLSPREAARLAERLQEIRSSREDLVSGATRSGEGLPIKAALAVAQVKSGTGMIVYHCPDLFTIAIIPPFPIEEESLQIGSAFSIQGINDMLEMPVMLVSIHAGDTFIGVSLSSAGFEEAMSVKSIVKEKHSKGGWSQRRFERLREEDIRSHLGEVQEKLDGMLERFRPLIKYAVLSGERSLIRSISVADIPVLERRLERHDSRRQEEILEDLYSFSIYRG